jgi:hypothetical protein
VGRTSSGQLVLRRTRPAPIYPDLLGLVLGHPAGVADQVSLAWLATSIPTLGGALGAALRPHRVAREDTNALPVLGVASGLASGRGWSHH